VKLKVAKQICQYSGELQLRKNYSGRSMYGKQVAGVVGSEWDYNQAVIDAAVDIAENDFGQAEAGKSLREFLKEALHADTDNMGYDTIWY
jgi:hypothetical protein